MPLSEKAEEILETLWIQTEEERKDSLSPKDLGDIDENAMKELLTGGYIALSEGSVVLTSKGRLEAATVVRRHRLAERLLSDVLHTGEALMEERACKFEHVIDQGLDESICTILGHPKVCPHGKPIPPGRCCLYGEKEASKFVIPLSELRQGQKGKIAYIYAPEPGKLQKLTNMGILPGAVITLIQSFPSYVFQVRQAQFAVDKEIADSIYVRLTERGTTQTGKEERQKQGGGWRRRLRWSPPR